MHRVSFIHNLAQAHRHADDYRPDESQENLIHIISKLKKQGRLVEQRLPMLSYKTDDELSQIKRFILVYYHPALHKVEIDTLQA